MTDTQHVNNNGHTPHPIMDRLRGIPDPRKGNHLRHACPDLLFAALLCVMCGYDSYRAFARFAQLNREWLRGRGCAFANGLPSRCAFRHLFVRLDPAQGAASGAGGGPRSSSTPGPTRTAWSSAR